MKILAYDTSQNVLSVAVTDGKRVLAEFQSEAFAKHSDALVPLIEKTLRKAHVRPGALDYLALDIGPGSFTGIRVGAATAKMLALVWKKKIVAVSSLEGLAFSAGQAADGRVAVLMDARKGKVYVALYQIRDGKMKVVNKPSLTTTENFLKQLGSPVLFTGNDPAFLGKILPSGMKNVHVDRFAPPGGLSASTIARAALDKIVRKEFVSPEQLEPLYLHPRDCNVTKKKK